MENYIVYIMAAILWGIFAVNMQLKVHPKATMQEVRVVVVLFLNAIAWPVCMLIAIYCLISGKHDEYFVNG